MTTLKDVYDSNYSQIWVVNIKDYDVVDMINNADKYIITKMAVFEKTLNVSVKRIRD